MKREGGSGEWEVGEDNYVHTQFRQKNDDDDDDVLIIYLLTAIGLPPGGSSTAYIYIKQYIEQHK
jgi:hypothetical protein